MRNLKRILFTLGIVTFGIISVAVLALLLVKAPLVLLFIFILGFFYSLWVITDDLID